MRICKRELFLMLCGIWFTACAAERSTSRAQPMSGGSAASPYADNSSSTVPSLSQQEVDDLLAGRGLGMARAAELNGYPGPRHVLDLQKELALDEGTIAEAQRLFDEMKAAAQPLGAEVVQLEKQLGERFAGRTADEDTLTQRVDALAALMGQLRAVHLRAHIQMTALLTAPQIKRYQQLRGYAVSDADASGTAGSSASPHAHHHGS